MAASISCKSGWDNPATLPVGINGLHLPDGPQQRISVASVDNTAPSRMARCNEWKKLADNAKPFYAS
ncbi:hypothetical protein ASC80_22810 [Afipia sp. Root123D2]|nr:hypothetical protein ASC80_22810 [Afipia sp. Root123D2]